MAVTITDVARRAGVSSATVSRVLSGKPHVRGRLEPRVLEAVDALGYTPSRVAQSLRAKRSKIVGLIVSDIQNPFFTALARAVEDAAQAQGYAVFLCNSDENPVKEKRYLDLFLAERVAGVIVAPTSETATDLGGLTLAGIPVVAVDRLAKGFGVDTVLTDNEEASRRLVRGLLEQGNERVGAVLHDPHITTGRQRLQGYKRALTEAGLPFDETLVRSGKPTVEDGYVLAGELLGLPRPPDGLFAGSKLIALGVLRRVLEAGLTIPGDLALASFDRLDWTPCTPPMLCGVQPVYDLGVSAVRLLFERLESPGRPAEHLVLPTPTQMFTPQTLTPQTLTGRALARQGGKP
ncbi:substrate-binding domain-containing protein [soil metagenome]